MDWFFVYFSCSYSLCFKNLRPPEESSRWLAWSLMKCCQPRIYRRHISRKAESLRVCLIGGVLKRMKNRGWGAWRTMVRDWDFHLFCTNKNKEGEKWEWMVIFNLGLIPKIIKEKGGRKIRREIIIIVLAHR